MATTLAAASVLLGSWFAPPMQAQTAPNRIISFSAPGSQNTYPYAINNWFIITGYFVGADSRIHGFIRGGLGDMTTFDPPGSINTWSFDINDGGTTAGFYQTATVCSTVLFAIRRENHLRRSAGKHQHAHYSDQLAWHPGRIL